MNFNTIMVAIATAFTITTAVPADAFDAKSKPITVVIPFAPGGGVDQTFRHLQNYAAQKGINMVAIYKPGAEGLISMSELATRPHDGYNISITTAGVIAYYRLRNPSTDVVPITGIRDSITAFVAYPGNNIKTLNELEQALQQGKDIKFGQGAPGQKMVVNQLLSFMKPKVKPVIASYKGGSPVVTDLLGGHIDIAAVPLSIVKSHIDSGKLRLIGLGSRSKFDGYPGVEFINKKYPAWEETDGFTIAVEKNTDSDAVKFWNSFMKEYLQDLQVQKDFIKDGTIITEFGNKEIEQTITSSKKMLRKIENE